MKYYKSKKKTWWNAVRGNILDSARLTYVFRAWSEKVRIPSSLENLDENEAVQFKINSKFNFYY